MFVVIIDAGYLIKHWNKPALSFAGQSIELRETIYSSILRTMSDGGWLATAVLRMMDYFKVVLFLKETHRANETLHFKIYYQKQP